MQRFESVSDQSGKTASRALGGDEEGNFKRSSPTLKFKLAAPNPGVFGPSSSWPHAIHGRLMDGILQVVIAGSIF